MIRICFIPAVQMARGYWISERSERCDPITLLKNPKWRLRAGRQWWFWLSHTATRPMELHVEIKQYIITVTPTYWTALWEQGQDSCYNTWYIIFPLQMTGLWCKKTHWKYFWWYIWKLSTYGFEISLFY